MTTTGASARSHRLNWLSSPVRSTWSGNSACRSGSWANVRAGGCSSRPGQSTSRSLRNRSVATHRYWTSCRVPPLDVRPVGTASRVTKGAWLSMTPRHRLRISREFPAWSVVRRSTWKKFSRPGGTVMDQSVRSTPGPASVSLTGIQPGVCSVASVCREVKAISTVSMPEPPASVTEPPMVVVPVSDSRTVSTGLRVASGAALSSRTTPAAASVGVALPDRSVARTRMS